jgi:imidazolonepropionase
MTVLRRIGALATCSGPGQRDVGLIRDAALAWENDRITWVGRDSDLPVSFKHHDELDAGGRLVVPGLVDAHTHLAFGGWRAEEFELKIQGKGYLEIAAAGGGIASTVAKTRAATWDYLLNRCRAHLRGMAALGVTTIECKSGYGLSVEDELRLLEVYRALGDQPQRIVPTFLGAHTIPPEHQQSREAYVDLVINEMIPPVADRNLAAFCDVFVEQGSFSHEEARRIFAAGKARGLRPKLHADQITANGGAELAAAVGAISADHLERVSDAGIAALHAAGVVGVTLPFASLYLNFAPAPARRMIDAGLAVAVATDFNPGSAPSYHLPMAMTLACTMQRMTPAEVLMGATRIAARAIGLEQQVGSLAVGKDASLAEIEADSVEQWLYHLRANACFRTVARGKVLHGDDTMTSSSCRHLVISSSGHLSS